MTNTPTKSQLTRAFRAAGKAHHEYEMNYLDGNRDTQWAGWYAAYVLGQLGEFAAPTALTQWLEKVSSKTDWPSAAAEHVLHHINPDSK